MDILTFRETFNFRSFIASHMLIEDTKEVNEAMSHSARIVGQESDGTMLLVWDSPLKGSKDDTIVTHFGAYRPSTPSYRTIYTHENQINVTGATIDQYQSLLAFTVSQELNVSGDISYDTFIAEINPCNRVFSLNISSPDYRKVQFVHSLFGTAPSARKGIKKSILLVIIPENWVCSYSFQLEPTHKGTMVMDQPIIDSIVKNISWYQWDPKLQWFCYARFGTAPTQTKRGGGKGNVSDSSLVLHVISFSGEEHKTLLTVALPIPIKYTHYTQPNVPSTYYTSPLGFTLPAKKLNMKVIQLGYYF